MYWEGPLVLMGRCYGGIIQILGCFVFCILLGERDEGC